MAQRADYVPCADVINIINVRSLSKRRAFSPNLKTDKDSDKRSFIMNIIMCL